MDPNTYLLYAGGYIGQSKPWGGWEARVGVTGQQSSPTTETLSKDGWDLLGFTTKTHSPEVRGGAWLRVSHFFLHTRCRCTIACVYNSLRPN